MKQLLSSTVAAVLIMIRLPVMSYATTVPVFIASQNFQGCLEVKDFNTNQNRVYLEDCDSDIGGWTIEKPEEDEGPFMFKSRSDPTKCLQAGYGQRIQDGTKLRLLDCNPSNPFQRFLWDGYASGDGTGPIKAAFRGNFCVAFRGVNANVGSDPIIIKHCDVLSEERKPWLAISTDESLQDEPRLFAKYDWWQQAKDVSGVAPFYDGELEDGVTASSGTLSVFNDQGVKLGYLSELDGATIVLFKFEQVAFTIPWGYSVLLGGGYEQWWVGVYRDIAEWVTEPETHLIFNIGGWGPWNEVQEFEHRVRLDDPNKSSFDSIEYLFNGTAIPTQRLAIRYNAGEWVYGGEPRLASDFPRFPVADPTRNEYVKVNDGARADWDHWNGTLGTMSLWASVEE